MWYGHGQLLVVSVLSKLGRELRAKERVGDDRVEGEMEREWG